MKLLRSAELLLWLVLVIPSTMAIRWIGIQHSLNHEWRKKDCNRKQGLTGKQYSMCRRNLPIMKYVREAVEMTREECVYQMQQRRWNCSSISKAPRYSNDLKRGTKESAFVYSLSAAAVSYSVTQACSTRQLGSICSCGRNPKLKLKRRDQWQWGGCSDNIAYGTRFSKRFTEAVENHRMKKKPKGADQTLMNIHNAEVGRRAVRDHMKIHCKCHGVSGSCNIKTCFRRLGDFRDVALFLRKRYDKIIYVRKHNKQSESKKEKRKRKFDSKIEKSKVKNEKKKSEKISLRPKGRRRHYTTKDLIALGKSPNYCRKSKKQGTPGTKGRICNPKRKRGKGSCAYLCCGRGHRTKVVIKKERCGCQYVWCCYVKCKTCTKRELVSRCR